MPSAGKVTHRLHRGAGVGGKHEPNFQIMLGPVICQASKTALLFILLSFFPLYISHKIKQDFQILCSCGFNTHGHHRAELVPDKPIFPLHASLSFGSTSLPPSLRLAWAYKYGTVLWPETKPFPHIARIAPAFFEELVKKLNYC